MSPEQIRTIAIRPEEYSKEQLQEALVFALRQIDDLQDIREKIPRKKTPVDELLGELPESLCADSKRKLGTFFEDVACELKELKNYTDCMQDKTNSMADRLETADRICKIAKEIAYSPEPVGSHKIFELQDRLKEYGE